MVGAVGSPRDLIRAGLTKVELLPVGAGYLDAGLAVTWLRGTEAYAEAGWHVRQGLALYGQGYPTAADAGVMAGVRWTW